MTLGCAESEVTNLGSDVLAVPLAEPSAHSALSKAIALRRYQARTRGLSRLPQDLSEAFPLTGSAVQPPEALLADLELVTGMIAHLDGSDRSTRGVRMSPPSYESIIEALCARSGSVAALRQSVPPGPVVIGPAAPLWAARLTVGVAELIETHWHEALYAIRCGPREWCVPGTHAVSGDIIYWTAPAYVGTLPTPSDRVTLVAAGAAVSGCEHLESLVASLIAAGAVSIEARTGRCTADLLLPLSVAGWISSRAL